MLTKTAINAAAPLASLLADKGIMLIPMVGSPIAELVQASRYMLDVGVAMESLPDPAGQTLTEYAGALQASSAEEVAGANEHDLLMEQVTDNVAEGVRFTQSLARTITPMIEAVNAGVEKALDGAAAAGLNPLNIVRRDYSQFANPVLVEGLAGQYGLVHPDQFNLTLRIPMPENVADYLLTGQGAIDEAVAGYVESIGAEGVKSLWERLFGGEASILTQIANEHKPETYGDAALAMIIVRNLQQSAPAGVNTSLEEMNSYLLKMQQQLGRILFNVPKQIDASVASGRLVLNAPRGERPRGDIVVNGALYQQYLEKGGTPEAIFGALNDGMAPGLNDLLEKQDVYSKRWSVTKQTLQNGELEGRFRATVTALSRGIATLIAELPEDQLIAPRETLHQRLAEQIGQITGADLEDRWALIRRLICRVIFPHTQAEQLLCLIDGSGKSEAQIEEAVLTATTAYVVKWCAAFITKKSV